MISQNEKLFELFYKGYSSSYNVDILNSFECECHWICIWINLYYNYIKHTKISWKRFGLDLVIDHIINISKCNPVASSSYIKLRKELDHSPKSLIDIQNADDNECFKWC